jgi:hypothetical protein
MNLTIFNSITQERSPLPVKITVILILLMLSVEAIVVISLPESNGSIAAIAQLESQEILASNNSEKSSNNQPNDEPVEDPEQINDGLI